VRLDLFLRPDQETLTFRNNTGQTALPIRVEAARRLLQRLIGTRHIHQDRKAGSSADRRARLDLVLKNLNRAAHDEQSQSEPIRLRRLKAMKRLKDSLQASGRMPVPVS
jgi:hypothetical protein